jgi:ATP-GRASP peptide maturase of grasp-with-spasm system
MHRAERGQTLILIFSVSRDQGTNAVVSWLDRYGRKTVRINDDEPGMPPVRIEMDNSDLRFEVDGQCYSTADIAAIWYRKGSFWFPETSEAPEFPNDPALSRLIDKKLLAENRVAAEYFHHLVRDKGIRVLGNPFLNDPNKLIVLHEAKRLGLKVPSFDVINRLSERHLADPTHYITKAISDGVYLWDVDDLHRGYFSYTECLGDALATGGAGEPLPLSMVQEKIRKRFEIRTFFLDGTFVSSAIYSQDDPQTTTDYRKYNTVTPNRNVPMVLPDEIAFKLAALFARLELNTGSVDMIVDSDGDFVLLEINPMGIFGGLMSVCNYSVDQAIAKWLCGEAVDDWRFENGDDVRPNQVVAAGVSDHVLQDNS